MDHQLVLLVLLCFRLTEASLVATPIHSQHALDHHLHDHMAARLTSPQPHFHSHSDFVINQRRLEEAQFTSSVGRHEKRDLEALLSFRRAITADPQGVFSNWTSHNSADICSWHGITCRKHSRRVVAVYLSLSGLEGTLSPSLGNLSLLHSLFLYDNKLTGRIPTEFRHLKAFRALDLSLNHLSGFLPASIFCLPLSFLSLDQNSFTGSIPKAIGNLSQLTELYLYDNKLTGSIPEAIANLSRLEILSLWGNGLTGSIPEAIANLSQLTKLDLEANALTGSIPEAIAKLSTLEYLFLSKNALTGTIPKGIGKLHSLKALALSSNNLIGTLPKFIGQLHSLEYLYLGSNNFTGSIPDSINDMGSLYALDLSQNNFQGPIRMGICTLLETFSAHSNNFSGTLSTSLIGCTQLQFLDLRKNRLTGELPSYLAFFQDLRVLSLAYNNFHGVIPPFITNFTKLHVLDLSNNNLIGKIPSNLERLFGYKINVSLYSLDYKEGYSLDINYDMKGREYSSYMISINTIFDLSSNHLDGEIPTSIGSMYSLRLLNLSWNLLEGPIPTTLSNISTLKQLDLAQNNLSGEIPIELSKSFELTYLNVSSNNLCGPIPMGTQFSTFNVTSFQRNKCLSGCPLDTCNGNKKLEGEGNNSDKSSMVKVGWLSCVDEKISLMALVTGLGIGFGGVVLVFVVSKKARCWLVPSKAPRPYYGVYRFPK